MERNKTTSDQLWSWFNRILLILAFIAAVCTGAALLYSAVTEKVIEASIQSMERLALHDETFIMNSVEYRWTILEGVGEECGQTQCETTKELENLLYIKEQGMDCLELALADERGNVYYGSLAVSEDEDIKALCTEDSPRFVVRSRGQGEGDGAGESLVFGTRIIPFSVGDRTFTHIICRFPVDTLSRDLKMNSYEGVGLGSVMDEKGNYIISLNQNYRARESGNFYTDLERCRLFGGDTIDNIRERMNRRETFTIRFQGDNGQELSSLTPMEGMDWYFVTSVSKTVFIAQSMDILRIILVIVIGMVIAMVMLLLLALRSRYAVRQARLEQSYRKELTEALTMAEEASRAKTTFLNNMSHDIRTPMNAIIGFTALAISHIDEKEQVQDYLSKISHSSNHLLSLINDVLDMSRIESGKVVIEEEPENLAEILHNIQNMIQTDIHFRQLQLFIDAVNVMDEEIFCDKLRINQILLNLLSNAMKFTPAGGCISVKLIQKESRQEGEGVYEFRVKDTGIGMSQEFAETIFEPFTRERTSTVSGIQGTGLGMSITKNIVDMMGGQIRVFSEKGKGTEFVVTLTLKLQNEHREPEPIDCLKGFRALVVDDDTDSCESVSQMLEKIGMRSEWTVYGSDGVARAQKAMGSGDEYHLYIIDWLMPDLGGVETARQIRKIVGEGVPIILLSAYDWTEIEEDARTAGVTGFINKPLFYSELYRTLTRLYGPQPEEETKKEDEEKISFMGRRILLVEDNELNREIATEILHEVGVIVETAQNGREAVEAVRESAPGYYDLVLMDVQMPVMDGYEATREIRALKDPALADILIIAMTANAFEEDRKAALDAGMNAHVGKPINIPTLMDTLSIFLARRR